MEKIFLLIPMLVIGTSLSATPAVPDYHGVVRVNKGEAVTLKCTVAAGDIVTWIQVQESDSHFLYIYSNGDIQLPGIKHRYNVSDSANGDFTLTILNIQPNDAGRYFCLKGNFTKKPDYIRQMNFLYPTTMTLYIIYVDVMDDSEYFQVSAHVGDTLTLPCNTSSNDVDWKYNHNEYVYLSGHTLHSRFMVNRSVAGVYNLVMANVWRNDSGRYSCVEDSGLGRRHVYTVNITERMVRVAVHSNAYMIHFSVSIAASIATVTLTIIIAAVLWRYARKRQHRKMKTERQRLLDDTKGRQRLEYYRNSDARQVNSKGGGDVYGVTLLNDRLYVLRVRESDDTSWFNMYSPAAGTWQLDSPPVTVYGQDLRDVTSCVHRQCLYACDFGAKSVLKLDLSGVQVSSWPVDEAPVGLSVSSSRNLLVTSGESSTLLELETETGQCLRRIHLPDEVQSPRHAILLPSGEFLVSHGEHSVHLHRVRKVSADGGTILESFGADVEPEMEKLHLPCQLAVDKDGFVFVADCWNNRLVLLTPTLMFVRKITIDGSCPRRLCLDHFHRMKLRLYVGLDEKLNVVEL